MANNGKVFLALLSFLKRRGSADDLIRSSKRIKDISEFEKIGESIIDIEFDDSEKIPEYLGMNENDLYLYNNVNSSYSDYEIIDSYNVKESFLEGYGFVYLYNKETIESVQKISKILLGRETNFNENQQVVELNQVLYEEFPKECDNIIYEYCSEINHAISDAIRNDMNKEIGEVLKKYDFKVYNLETIRIRAADLFSYYLEYNAPNLNVTHLFEKIFSRYQIDGGWYENAYEYESSADIDKDSFNNYVQREFDTILDKVESEFNEDVIKNYYKLVNDISKKFPINKELPIPKTKKYNFVILGFDKEGPKIVIKLINNETRATKNITLTEENFNYLLYQPTLFDFDDI